MSPRAVSNSAGLPSNNWTEIHHELSRAGHSYNPAFPDRYSFTASSGLLPAALRTSQLLHAIYWGQLPGPCAQIAPTLQRDRGRRDHAICYPATTKGMLS
eukprot:scaffold136_cov418-Prasinococcus_capsulatus_cf.AAC.8